MNHTLENFATTTITEAVQLGRASGWSATQVSNALLRAAVLELVTQPCRRGRRPQVLEQALLLAGWVPPSNGNGHDAHHLNIAD